MANSDDLDLTIDGYDSVDTASKRRHKNRAGFDDYDTEVQGLDTSIMSGSKQKPKRKGHRLDRDAQASSNQRNQTRENTYAPSLDEVMTNNPAQDEERVVLNKDKYNRTSRWALIRFFQDSRLHMFLGLFLVLVCVFIIIALFSHFKNGEVDQSVVINSTLSEMATSPEGINNAGGSVGAWLSQVLLCDTLGLGVLPLLVYVWLLALHLMDVKKCSFWSLTLQVTLLSITISVVLGLLTYNSESVMRWGGNHGHYVNKFLFEYTSPLGAILVSAALILAVACLYLNEIRSLWEKWKAKRMLRKIQDELLREKERELENISDAPAVEENVDTAEATESTAVEQTNTVSITLDDDFLTEGENKKTADDASASLTEENDIEKNQDETLNKEEEGSEEDTLGFKIEEDNKEQSVFSNDVFDKDDENIEEITIENSDSEIKVIEQSENVEEVEVVDDDTKQEDNKDFLVTVPEIEKAPDVDESASIVHKDLSQPYDHKADLSRYEMPPIDLLIDRPCTVKVDMEEQQANKDKIIKTLLDYNIPISRIEATVGPTVTLYEIVPAEGVRIAQIKRLEDDIALSLAATGIRIIAPMPGKGTVGIEVPNLNPQTVSMRSVISSKAYTETKCALPMALGTTIQNEVFIADMAKMPHLLVAGATGMGKSVGLNAIITSLIYRKHPSELKFVLIDPKMVEFSLYAKLERHYLAKMPDEEDAVITDPQKAILALSSLCVEMDDRYNLLKNAGVRELSDYNKKFTARKLNPENGHHYMPYIVVVVDEFADLIMMGGKEVEAPIMRIAQKARAVGIHMIIATQRPATNVITGNIKANFPGRIAFRVIQMEDSRTILGGPGANRLIGRGDMLFSHNGNMERVQCAFMSTEEVEAVTDWIDNQVGYAHAYYLPEAPNENADAVAAAGASGERDPLFDEAARYVVNRQIGSTSSLQRQFNIGYNRAGRLMDQMEAAGIIGPQNGSKARNILVDSATLEQIISQ